VDFEDKVSLIAYKELIEVTDEDWSLLGIEKNRCQAFTYFIKYCKIVEPPTQDTRGGVTPLVLWPHTKKIVKTLLTEQLITVLKARQIGLSTIVAAYILWFAMFHVGANIILFSKGESEAKELLGKAKRIFDNLPPFLKLKADPDSTEMMAFPSMKSRIHAFPSTPNASIGETTSVVVCDEHSEHPYADENYLSSKPTRDAGGQFISIFTSNKLQPDNLATAIFQDAMDGKNDFVPLFFPWSVRPGRDAEWFEKTKRNIPQRELARITGELYMEQNYPASIEEALRSTQTVSAFDHKVLDEMTGNTKSSIEVVRDGVDPLIVKIYQDFHIGEYYIAGTDTSHGIGRDFGVTTVMNVKTGSVVADILNNKISPQELALHSVRLLDIFRNPLWYIENNDWGGQTCSTAQDLNYRNLGYQDKARKKVGFNTNDSSRHLLWGGLIAGINNRQITIFSVEGLKQFFNVIRNSKADGRIEAVAGRHDDYPIAVGICWLKKDEVHTQWNVETTKTLTFSHRR